MAHSEIFPSPEPCPLCGQPNGCAVQAGRDPASCWCTTAVIPRELLDRVPAPLRGKACICRDCVEAFRSGFSPGIAKGGRTP